MNHKSIYKIMYGKTFGICGFESFPIAVRAPLMPMGMRQNDEFETAGMP